MATLKGVGMATLNGAGNNSALKLELYETPYSNGFSRVELHAGTDRLGAWFRTTEILAALDAVPKARADNDPRKSKERAEAAEAKLARVRATVDKWRSTPNSYVQHGSHLANAWAAAATQVEYALADPEPFELPTTPGAGITALYEGGRRLELRLFADGEWAAKQTGRSYTPAGVMIHFTNHRLIEEPE